MLVLSRRIGETIILGDGITVTVADIRGDRVQLGIEAPENVRILRGELTDVERKDARTHRER